MSGDRIASDNRALSQAAETLSEICRTSSAHSEAMLARAVEALADWSAAQDPDAAAEPRARFYRAIAALEAEADLYAADSYSEGYDPALIPGTFEQPLPESAIFTLEEAAAPFLGPASGAGARVLIAIEAPGYQDLFTVYFPRGSAYLTLPAGDMVAMAAEAVRDYDQAQIWISSDPALTPALAEGRMGAIRGILVENEIPEGWIHLDDGGLDAMLNRPASLRDDLAL
jgi:hypothetical protein